MTINKASPNAFGNSYDIGWIGFSRTFDFESDAIAYGERWEREGNTPSVNHAFIVTDVGMCIQAHAGIGVAYGKLTDYFDNPKCKVYFRKPKCLTSFLASKIVFEAKSKLGCKYDDEIIIEQALSDSFIGHLFNVIFRDWPHKFFSRMLIAPNEFICSQLAAYALASQPEYAQVALLKNPLSSIDPQALFQCEDLFESDANDCSMS